ncbi:hypothetical protein NKR23_g12259 [Pleurostoma richardsiae]|uniref:H-type lectin domain-containing protein n=1 Tax=Pleurostoma richardsiae TaxID=41990 RepID=A0AA38R831_9PEZI|nr:hypothetical protein NKR23_g12259 [Pleurostoma richardsiae]
MPDMSSELPRDLAQLNLSRYSELTWPDHVSIDQESVDEEPVDQEPVDQEPVNQTFPIPALTHSQATVNIYNSGSTGPGAGPSTTGSDALYAGGGGGDLVSALAMQLAALSQRVELLSLRTSGQRLVLDCGRWHTSEVRSSQQPRQRTEGRVNFRKEFRSIPSVMVSMCSIYATQGARAKVYATTIDLKGFTVHAESWGNTKLFSCGASWVAMGE